MALEYRHGGEADGRVTESDLAREPRSLEVFAWYDAWGQAGNNAAPYTYPRALTAAEVRAWRAGWAAGKRDRAQTWGPL